MWIPSKGIQHLESWQILLRTLEELFMHISFTTTDLSNPNVSSVCKAKNVVSLTKMKVGDQGDWMAKSSNIHLRPSQKGLGLA